MTLKLDFVDITQDYILHFITLLILFIQQDYFLFAIISTAIYTDASKNLQTGILFIISVQDTRKSKIQISKGTLTRVKQYSQ